ncbi:MAG: CCA tRNA nucleotidyltransferase [Bacteroidales bacterium]|nr:CCA tRNA nucleotidyltransferase [Bacteroidales bacterium]
MVAGHDDKGTVLNNRIFQVISKVAAEENRKAYVIGGFVRDTLLGKKCKDIDVVVLGNGPDFARRVAAELKIKKGITVYENFGTAMIRWRNYEIEFVGARKESYQPHSRKPLVEEGSLKDDQLRRDFTINAMAFSLNPEDFGLLIDPFNGIQDLHDRIIRTPTNPDITFSDDPLRMMRAIRFATQLNFDIHPDTLAGIKKNCQRIEIVSMERVTDELNKIIAANTPSIGFYLLSETGLLSIIFPELEALKGVENIEGHSHKDNFRHTLEVLDNVARRSDNIWLRWSALLHDIAKPITKRYTPQTGWTFHGHEFVGQKMVPSIFKRFRLPLHDKMRYVQKLVGLHLRPIVLAKEEVTDSAVRRLLFDAGNDIEDLMLLCEADITSKNQKLREIYLENFKLVRQKLKEIEEKDRIRNFQPPIDGNEIVRIFNIPPSKLVGILKNAIKDAILDGIIPNEYDAAYEFLIRKAEEMGLKPTVRT